MSKEAEKKRIRELRAERRKAGCCLDCGSPDLAKNGDGTLSRFCEPHQANYAMRMRPKRQQRRSQVVREPDEQPTIWDTADGDKMLDDIDQFVKQEKIVTIRMINEMFPEYIRHVRVAIDLLRVLYKVSFDEHAARPMKIYTRNGTPPSIDTTYNRTMIPSQKLPVTPFTGAMYGSEFERQR